MIDPYRAIDRSIEFRPVYSADHTARMVRGITQNPHLYTEQSLKAVKDHAAYHKIPFDPPEQVSIDPKQNEFNLMRGIGEVGEGFLSGFSTFEVGEPSENTYEQILRSVGHLAGFVGYIPAAPFTAMKAYKMAELAKALKGRSVPMAVATQVQKQAKKVVVPTLEKAAAGRAGVTKQVSEFLLRDTPSHLAEGAFHLGLASSVGSWQHGVDEMLRSGAHGAVTGAAFRGIGEIFKGGGVPKIDKYTQKKVMTVDQRTDQAMRMLSSSLWEGLQSSYRGDTTPEQVYSYLLGAFFGAHETSVTERSKNKFMVKMERQRHKNPAEMMSIDKETNLPLDLKETMYNPKLIPGYEKLNRSTQKAVNDENSARYGTWLENPSIAKIAIENAGIIPEDVLAKNPEVLAELQGVVDEVLKGNNKPKKPAYISEEEAIQMGKATQIKDSLIKGYNLRSGDRFDKIVAKSAQPTSNLEKSLVKDPVFRAYRDFMLNKTDTIEVDPNQRLVKADHKMSYKMPVAENIWGEETTTLAEAESGRRTATTRSFKLGNVGDVFTLEGRPQKYEVTEVEKLTDAKRKDKNFVKKWSRKEGWTEEHFKKQYDDPTVKTVGPERWQTTFKMVERTKPDYTLATGIKKVISGGQLGPDMDGLRGAEEVGITTGGTAAKGYAQQPGGAKTRYSNEAEHKRYGLTEGESVMRTGKYGDYEDVYSPRTEKNVVDSDGTVIFGDTTKGGTKLTLDLIKKHDKPYKVNPTAQQLRDWANENKIEVLNVAGSRSFKGDAQRIIERALAEAPEVSRRMPMEVGSPTDEVYDKELHAAVIQDLRGQQETTEASDTGTINTSPAVENRARQFLTEFLGDRYSDLTERQITGKKDADVLRIYDKLNEIIKAGQGREKVNIDSDQLIENINSEFEVNLGQDAQNSLRQMLRRKILTKNPQHYSVRTLAKKGAKKSSAIVLEKLAKNRPVNAAGNSKDMADSKKVYEDSYNRVNRELAEGNKDYFYHQEPWVVIDHYVKLDGKHFKDPPLSDAMSDPYLHKNFRIDILRQMANPTLRAAQMGGATDNMGSFYYYSGKSDAGKMFFYRYHPGTFQALGRGGGTGELFKTVKEVLGGEKQYKKLRKEFLEEYSHQGIKKEMSDYFDASFMSNVMWQVENSGLRTKTSKNPDGRNFSDAFKIISDSSKISSPKAWNKRMQIWMTDGQEADPSYYINKSAAIEMTDQARNSILNGKLRYALYEDSLFPQKDLTDKSEAEKFVEATDGAIDVESRIFDVINNDFGMPVSGQNKSFIVEPHSTHGALLGKFMFHRAPPEQSAWMRKKGLHIMIPRSSAKDSGTREFIAPFTVSHKGTRTTISEKELASELDGGKVYELDIKAIKGLLSEANTDHLIHDQSTPKQIMTNLTRYAFSEIQQETIDNMFNTWNMPKFTGEGVYNDIVTEIVKKKPNEVSANDIRDVVENIDKVGLPTLLHAIQNTRHHTLVGEMYKRILKVNTDVLAEQKQEGEITNEQYESALRESREFNSSINRMMTLNPHIAVFHYKDARGWLQNAMRNFAVHTVTRPKQPNSMGVRMRPYNPWMKSLHKKLNTNDRIFLLDDMYRDRLMDVTGVVTGKKYRDKNKVRFGQLWDEYKDRLDAFPKVKDFFNAIGLRVPMDSLSGAHNLEFGGFTGIKGHGGVIHPRVMQALGGADLDGDKAFILFGQNKKFREAYDMQREEFKHVEKKEGSKYKDPKAGPISKEGVAILNENPSEFDLDIMKKQRKDMNVPGKMDFWSGKVFWDGMSWRNLLTKTPEGKLVDPVYDKMAMYTPHHRLAMSDGASGGRYQLGPAVVSRAILSSTHASLMAAKEHKIVKRYINKKDRKSGKLTDTSIASISQYNKLNKKGKALYEEDYRDGFEVSYKASGKGPGGKVKKTGWVFIEPRENLAFARDLYKSEIGFTSDPMDETALAGREAYFNWGHKAFFKTDMSNIPKQFRPQIQPHTHLRHGRFQQIYDFNHGYFGRNWQLGRRHTPSEIKSMAREIETFDAKERNTFLPKMAHILQPLELSDDIITRYDPTKVKAKYDSDPLNNKTHPIYQYADLLGRETFAIKLQEGHANTQIIMNTLTQELGTAKARAELVDKPLEFHKLFGGDIERLAAKGGIKPYMYDPYKYKADLDAHLEGKRKAKYRISGKRVFTDYALDVEKWSILREARSRRLQYIEDYVEKANDFLQNDQMSRGAADVIVKYIETAQVQGVENLNPFIERTAKFASRLKQLDRQIRNNAKLQTDTTKFMLDPVMVKDKKFIGAVKEVIDFDSKIPVGELRQELDQLIHSYKYNHVDDFAKSNVSRRLSEAEMDIVDALVLSPFYKGQKADIARLDKFRKKYPDVVNELIKELKSNQDGTYFSKVGVNSPEIGDKVLTDYLKAFSKEFDDVVKHGTKAGRPDKLIKEVDGEVPIYTDSKSGKPVQPNIYENDLEGLRRLTDKRFGREENLDGAARKIMTDLEAHLTYYNNSVSGKDINLLMRGMIGKNVDAMDLADFRTVNNMFEDMRTGNWFLKNWGKLDQHGTPLLSKRHWMMFPKAVSEEMILKDFTLAKQEGAFLNYIGEMKLGTVAKPTHYIERTQYAIGTAQAAATKANEDAALELQEMLTNKTGYESLPDGIGYDIYRVAFTERELNIGHGVRSDRSMDIKERQIKAARYTQQWKDAKKRADWDKIADKKFQINVVTEAGKTRKLTKTGAEIKDMIKDVITEVGKKRYRWIRGSQWEFDENLKTWVDTSKQPGGEHLNPWNEYYVKDSKGEVKYWDESRNHEMINVPKFVDYLLKTIKDGKPVPMDFGLDGMRNFELSVKLANPGLTKEYKTLLINQAKRDTGNYKPEEYNPHYTENKTAAKKDLIESLKSIEANENMSEEMKERKVRRLVIQYHKASGGDWFISDIVEWQIYDKVLQEIAEGRKPEESKVGQHLMTEHRAASMHSRQGHMGPWRTDPSVWEDYQKNLVDTYYRQIGQVISRNYYNDFVERYHPDSGTPGRKMSEEAFRGWSEFYSDYIGGALGFPSQIPDAWLEGPKKSLMNVSGTPYAWWADNRVSRRLGHIKKALGMKTYDKLPEELQGVGIEDIRHWSNLEAKFEMAALLAHPKSMMGNMYGGTLHTVQSVGWKTWRNSMNLEYLRKLQPGEKWESVSDLDRWAIGHGVVPEFIRYEAGLNPEFKGGKWKAFMNDAIDVIKNDPKVKDATLVGLAKEHGITESMFHKAAWFMREPERILRRQSFVAHWLQARENFGRVDMDKDHPMLINLAKKGVQATQFLYSAPYRPAFSRTSLGKVMTRFQTWAWNAVRFRREIIQEARRHGYTEGTQEFDRFKRLMLTDMFVFSMANVFAYSLFEAALPAPWSWFQDSADWIFGDEKERDKAFFGQWPKSLAPLQVITPPIARLPVSALRAFADDDFSRLSGYYIWTMFPFGRIARDVKGVVENPMMTVEKMTGLPYIQFAREATKYRKGDDEEE